MTATQTVAALIARAHGFLVDLDGTLVDSSAPVGRAWTAFAGRYGLDPEVVLRVAQGRPSRETVADLAPPERRSEEVMRLEEAECTDTAGTLPLPGAAALLNGGQGLVAGGRGLAIVTSCSTRLATTRLEAAGLPVPTTLVSADDVARGKPDPECFLLGARALQLTPGACLAFEDSPAGIAAARAAGVPVIALRTTHDGEDLDGADAIIGDLSALPA